MEGAVAAAEGGVAEGAEPGLADEGRAEEARGLIGREAEEDLANELGHQFRRRRRHGAAVCEDLGGDLTGAQRILQKHPYLERNFNI